MKRKDGHFDEKERMEGDSPAPCLGACRLLFRLFQEGERGQYAHSWHEASVEQYTFDGISAPSTTAEPAEATTKSSSGGSYIGSGNSYLGGYQAANRLPTAASPNAGYGSSSTTKPAGTTKKPSSADISQILGGFTGSLSMDNLGEINNYLLGQGIDTNALGINIGQLVSGLVDAKENESKQDAGNILDGIGDIIGSIGGGTTAKSGS